VTEISVMEILEGSLWRPFDSPWSGEARSGPLDRSARVGAACHERSRA
jgi:hypothetical protein